MDEITETQLRLRDMPLAHIIPIGQLQAGNDESLGSIPLGSSWLCSPPCPQDGCQEQPRSQTSSFFFLSNPHPRIYLLVLERKRAGRERERHQCKKHQVVASYTHPNKGSNPQPRYVYRTASNQLSHQAGAQTSSFTSSKRKHFSSHPFSSQ